MSDSSSNSESQSSQSSASGSELSSPRLLSQDDVLKVARLARITVSDEDVLHFQESLGRILDFVTVLNEVDTTDVEPMTYPIENSNVFREDVVTESLTRESALANAPQSDGEYFLVPAILNAD